VKRAVEGRKKKKKKEKGGHHQQQPFGKKSQTPTRERKREIMD